MEISFRSNSDDNFNMSDKEKKGKKKNSGLGLAIWILAFLIVIIVFLVKWDDIKNNLQKTRFFERLFGITPTFLADKNSAEKKDDENSENVIELEKSDDKKSDENSEKKSEFKKIETENDEKLAQKNDKSEDLIKAENQEKQTKSVESEKKSEEKKSENEEKPEKKLNQQTKTAEEKNAETAKKSDENDKKETASVKSSSVGKASESEKKAESSKEKNAEQQTKKIETATKPNTIATKICFVAIDSDGPVIRKEVNRQVAKDSPLTNAINSLLSGPNAAESKTGCRSLIPSGTKLYSAVVRNGVATLNFSEEFEFNTYGVEGYLGQLMQIVYTATNFSSVQSVQFLIEGEKKEYLGSEGVWIGSPLSRASFR